MRQKITALSILALGVTLAVSVAAGFWGGGALSPTRAHTDLSTAPPKPAQKKVAKSEQERQAVPTPPNLTNGLAAAYTGAIVEENRGTKSAGGGTLKLPSKESLQKTLEATLAADLPWERLTKSDIRVGSLDSPEAERRYIEAVDDAVHRNYDGFGKTVFNIIDTFNQTGSVEGFSELTARATRYLADLKNIEAPRTLADLHLDLVNLWQWKIAAYRAIASTADDPLNATLGINAVEPIVNEDARIQGALMARYVVVTTEQPTP